LRSLPDEFGTYSRWSCVNNSTGSVRPAQEEILIRKIEEKAAKLSEYRRVVPDTILLIHAEGTRESGMFSYAPGRGLLPSYGFSEVHFLIHPTEYWRIA
jgi:hypothetical protein